MKPFHNVDSAALLDHFLDCPSVIFENGDVVIDKERARDHVFLIRSGIVKVSMLSAKGSERLLYYASSGCLFGDSMVFGRQDEVSESLRGCATERCEVIKLRHIVFREALMGNPELLFCALAVAHRKFTIAIEQLEYATFKDTECQLADLLEAISTARDTSDTTIKMTHQDLADATGRTRVSVTNALSRLQDAGVVRLNRGRIELVAKRRSPMASSLSPTVLVNDTQRQ